VQARSAEAGENGTISFGTKTALHSTMRAQFTFRDLEVWKQGMDLVEACYKASAAFPKSEMYGLTSQLRRVSTSIPTYLAEGHGRRTTRAYLNHVSIAIGSQAELETCLELARRLGFLPPGVADSLLESAQSVGRLLYGLYRALDRKVSGLSPDP
jgi:four helix bundle protein